jgi:hypothetical protein
MSKDQTDKIFVNVYGTDAPKAAVFNKGARSLKEVQESIDARTELSKEQSQPSYANKHSRYTS